MTLLSRLGLSQFSVARAISKLKAKYPHISAPNLVASFLVLHELTAIVPVVGIFGALQYSGVHSGQRVSDYFDQSQGRAHDWYSQGHEKVARVGKRYGWFGYHKGSDPDLPLPSEQATAPIATSAVSNAIAAYLLVKLLLPLRIVACIQLAPRLSNSLGRTFQGLGDRWQKRRAS